MGPIQVGDKIIPSNPQYAKMSTTWSNRKNEYCFCVKTFMIKSTPFMAISPTNTGENALETPMHKWKKLTNTVIYID